MFPYKWNARERDGIPEKQKTQTTRQHMRTFDGDWNFVTIKHTISKRKYREIAGQTDRLNLSYMCMCSYIDMCVPVCLARMSNNSDRMIRFWREHSVQVNLALALCIRMEELSNSYTVSVGVG